jgi:hypothetical protein
VGGSGPEGALNYTSEADVVAAASDVWRGQAVSLGAPVEDSVAPDNPEPCLHQMTRSPAGTVQPDGPGAPGLSFALDRIAMNVHGNVDSHIDALSHVVFDGLLYNGISAQAVTATRATELSIDVVGGGIVGRGLLLDIPRVRGVRWLEPGDHVTADDLAAAETAQDVHIGQGDLLLSGSVIAVAGTSSERGTRPGPGLACIRRHLSFSPNGRSRRSAAMGTTTPPRAPSKVSAFLFTCWRSTRLACTCLIT